MYEMSNGITFLLVKNEWHAEKQTLTPGHAFNENPAENNTTSKKKQSIHNLQIRKKYEKSLFVYYVTVRQNIICVRVFVLLARVFQVKFD